MVSGVSVLGDDNLLVTLYAKGITNACIGVGSAKDNSIRKTLYEKVKQAGFFIPALFHPKTIVSKESKISEGVQIMAGAVIQVDSSIGKNTIINTGAIIEHDCNIGSHVHICPSTTLSGGCLIGEGAFIGAGATVIQGIRIGSNAIIAAGSVVVRDVLDNTKVSGVPAREVNG
jgi:UDP-perosamine 4-acetyltransferase